MNELGQDQLPESRDRNSRERGTAVVDLDIDAQPATVWRALTSDAGFAAWMGEGSQIDPAVGGHISSPDPVSGSPKEGRVERVDDGRRLDFTWWPDDDVGNRSSVSIMVAPCETGTRVTVTEERVAETQVVKASWSWRCSMLALTCAMARC